MSSYKSKFEQNFAKALKTNGIKFEYEQVLVSFVQPEKKRKYYPDFKIRTDEGVFIVETKGRFTAEDRKKMIWVRECNPDLNVILMFQNSNVPIRKGSKVTYADWCRKNNYKFFDFRFGLPKSWK